MAVDHAAVKSILSANVDPDSLSASLCAAAGEGNVGLVTTLLDARANPYTAVEANYMPEAFTPLGWAVKGKAKGKGLGKSGKGKGIDDERTRDYACVVQKLIDARASPTESGKGGDHNALGIAIEGLADIHVEELSPAQVADFIGMVKTLIQAGAVRCGKGEWSPPYKGVVKGTMKGCKGQAKGKGKAEGIPPVGGVEIMKALVEAGARCDQDDFPDHLAPDFVEMHREANAAHGERPPEMVKEALDAGNEVLKQLLLAKADVNTGLAGGKGLADVFEVEGEAVPSLKDVAKMVRECAATSRGTDDKLVAEVAIALGFQADEFDGWRTGGPRNDDSCSIA